ncbi:hypothetical protein, partial [Pseudomonas avellanae]|uniref:hypothetical protein n=1 Tax=Pseudomonas avellanae TaxID=46257 RepID=UPI001267E996
ASPGSVSGLSRHLRRNLRRQCHRDKKALSFNYRTMLRFGMQFWTLCVLFVALRVTQRFCDVSDACLRLKSPFRLSAPYFEGPK